MKIWSVISLLCLCFTFQSCSIFKSTSATVNIEADEKANYSAPVQIEFIFVTKQEIQNVVNSMSAQEWFTKREQFLRDNPNKDEVVSHYFEWIPGQKKKDIVLKGNGAIDAVVFVNYSKSSSANRGKVITGSNVTLKLRETKFEIITNE